MISKKLVPNVFLSFIGCNKFTTGFFRRRKYKFKFNHKNSTTYFKYSPFLQSSSRRSSRSIFYLTKYLSFCIKMTDSNDSNIQSAARHTTLEMCLDLIDNFEIYGSEKLENGILLIIRKNGIAFLANRFCQGNFLFNQDVFRMLISDEPPHWLSFQVKSHNFLLELLSCILTRNPSIFHKVLFLNNRSRILISYLPMK